MVNTDPIYIQARHLFDKNDKKALKLLKKSEKINKHHPIHLHFTYGIFVEYYWRFRKDSHRSRELCIHYGQKQLDHLFTFQQTPRRMLHLMDTFQNSANSPHLEQDSVRIPGVGAVVSLYLDQGEKEEALRVMKRAMEYDEHYSFGSAVTDLLFLYLPDERLGVAEEIDKVDTLEEMTEPLQQVYEFIKHNPGLHESTITEELTQALGWSGRDASIFLKQVVTDGKAEKREGSYYAAGAGY
ncbi:hypothetical protein HNR44_003054 [Geomicrobium halophilum]|uniref:Uncharacterized protein n=1 Tax=Geomicrobium halophilum TaxID=549000 RepID=A0A841PQK0_9BACL|nr:hypothetical protein [Geomicrobium halophilum]MBB6451060.1 hypothetical protein [Geomicrobium halophilum]